MRFRPVSCVVATLLTVSIAACGDPAPAGQPAASGSPSAPPSGGTGDGADAARMELAARAAKAEDYHFAALYTVDVDGQAQRTIMAAVAADGSWRVDIPGGALGGTADVSIVETEAGLFQCAIPSATNPIIPSCVRVADRGERVPKKYDPKIERVFRQWLPVFTDRQAALSVAAAQPLPGASGDCYSVDTISASLSAPVDVGIYCYTADGLLTAARVTFGTITIAGTPAAAPSTVQLPGQVTAGDPMGMDAPPPPPVLPSLGEVVPSPSA
ncbi:hypothetical protein [Actinoplanes sp. N902-109]|uniref:hypothetical protein n=1 Tax=Actinoplanes sp. (strain N902-109) TaxID=649831 RepID=UPI0003294861|nr:hypothetical protein [Actinoplanes sp. N902-109]AGL21431.1 hypothetical protein L083_7921 [Actinoplanes sp. N902-109]